MEGIKEGDRILYLWEAEISPTIEKDVHLIKQINKVSVNVENIERIKLASYESASFDSIIAKNITDTPDLLALLLKLLIPKGILIISSQKLEQLKNSLLFSGFVNAKILNDDNEIKCEKPNFEIGSSKKLSFAKKQSTENGDKAKIWKIDNDEDEIIDPDELLEEEDLVKPDESMLRVCGTTGKRKACKDCSCGLAEELDGAAVKATVNTNQKSSCGSCYLGDAFRCASCPYLGMPAFKPGEKVQLTDNLLKADA